MKCSYKKVFGDKKKIMFVFAHPDDAEIFAGGTIARLVNDKKEVAVVKMTLGNKGSGSQKISESNLAKQRKQEDIQAMKKLGIKDLNNIYIELKDGEVEDKLENIEKLVSHIREFRPDIVVTHNPENVVIRFNKDTNWINHRDHRNTGKITIDASYPYSRDILFFPEHFKNKNKQSHTVTEFLLVDYYDHPDTIAIDVTKFVEIKNKALAMHSSQYSLEDAIESTDFFTKVDKTSKRYERFRYVIAD